MSLDADAIARLRQRLERAESAGDADTVIASFTDDVVAMVPTAPTIAGRAACGAFVRQTLRGLLEVFERSVGYRADETTVFGDVAYERGTFRISCFSREDGSGHEATGKYVWLLRREGGEWRIARLLHAVDETGDKAPEFMAGPRLKLVRPKVSDVPEMFEGYASDPEVTRYLGWPRHRTVADTEAFVEFSDAEWVRAPAGPYLIRSTDSDRLIGSTGLTFNGPHNASTGFVLARHAWGRGYATDATRVMAGLAGMLGVSRLTAVCHADHTASRRVLEKCGFTVDETASPDVTFPNLEAGVPHSAVLYVLCPTPPVEDDA